MALLSFDDEMERAKPNVPFANGFEFDSWSGIWCEECVHETTCPLLMVILHEMTPGPWEDRNPGHLNRYVCHEFERRPDGQTPPVLRPAVP